MEGKRKERLPASASGPADREHKGSEVDEKVDGGEFGTERSSNSRLFGFWEKKN